jgi:hypothetical protein
VQFLVRLFIYGTPKPTLRVLTDQTLPRAALRKMDFRDEFFLKYRALVDAADDNIRDPARPTTRLPPISASGVGALGQDASARNRLDPQEASTRNSRARSAEEQADHDPLSGVRCPDSRS